MRTDAGLEILSIELCGPHSLRLQFNDGTTRRVNLLPFLKGNADLRRLRDPEYFAKFEPDEFCGTPEWPSGYSFAPEFLREFPEEPEASARPKPAAIARNGRVAPPPRRRRVRRFRGSRGRCTRAYWLDTAEGQRWAAKVRRIGRARR